MPDLIGIDFETRSSVDLPKHGAENYFRSEDADIVFLSFKVRDCEPYQWFPGEPLPDILKSDISINTAKYYAFNALFEYRAWNYIGVPKYGFAPMKLSSMIDVMAICGRFGFFQNLEQAGEVLNVPILKDKRGKALIKKICCPPFQYTQRDMYDFMEYGLTDVETMYHILKALPASKLSQKEQEIWEMTQEINLTGIPVDYPAAVQILKLTEIYKEEQSRRLPALTGGAVTKPTQTARIKNWLHKQLVPVPDLTADTVETTLKDPNIPEKAREVLELRRDLGKSSTAKYVKLIDQAVSVCVGPEEDGIAHYRIYDNLRYHAAGPGRWGGMGFQIHNLPRSKVVAQPIIDKFFDLSIIEEAPIQAAKDIIRGMICAPDGHLIMAADFHSVENVGLAWMVDDQKTLSLFRDGLDQYIDMASFVFKVPYDQVTDDQRQFGKILVLGCGYGLGGEGFRQNAAGWGITLSSQESQMLVSAYRRRYYLVVQFWYDCKNAALEAFYSPGTTVQVGKVTYKYLADRNKQPWLQCMLPSGRAIYYNDPQVVEGNFGPELTAMGIDSYTKKWKRLKIIPGRFVENVVQGFCRDLLAEGKLNLRSHGYKLIGSVHDEPIAQIQDMGEERNATELASFCKIMCAMPSWADGLPLTADGMVEKRYRKM